MRAIIVWNIIAIVVLAIPSFFIFELCLELLHTTLFKIGLGLITLILLGFAILIASVCTLYMEDREDSKKGDKP